MNTRRWPARASTVSAVLMTSFGATAAVGAVGLGMRVNRAGTSAAGVGGGSVDRHRRGGDGLHRPHRRQRDTRSAGDRGRKRTAGSDRAFGARGRAIRRHSFREGRRIRQRAARARKDRSRARDRRRRAGRRATNPAAGAIRAAIRRATRRDARGAAATGCCATRSRASPSPVAARSGSTNPAGRSRPCCSSRARRARSSAWREVRAQRVGVDRQRRLRGEQQWHVLVRGEHARRHRAEVAPRASSRIVAPPRYPRLPGVRVSAISAGSRHSGLPSTRQ